MAQFINQGFGNDGIVGVGGNDVVQGPIPLYQNGFNWLRFWLGCCLTLTLCILLATFITFLVLFILVVSGSIGNTGRMMPSETATSDTPHLNDLTKKNVIPPTITKFMENSKIVKSLEKSINLIKSNVQANIKSTDENTNKLLKNMIPAI